MFNPAPWTDNLYEYGKVDNLRDAEAFRRSAQLEEAIYASQQQDALRAAAAAEERNALDEASRKGLIGQYGQAWVDEQQRRGTLPIQSMVQDAHSLTPMDTQDQVPWVRDRQTAPGRWELPGERPAVPNLWIPGIFDDAPQQEMWSAHTRNPDAWPVPSSVPEMMPTHARNRGLSPQPIDPTPRPVAEPEAAPQLPVGGIRPYIPIAPGVPKWQGKVTDPFPFDKPRYLPIAPGQPAWKNRTRSSDKYRGE